MPTEYRDGITKSGGKRRNLSSMLKKVGIHQMKVEGMAIPGRGTHMYKSVKTPGIFRD